MSYWIIPGLKFRKKANFEKHKDPLRVAELVCEYYGIEHDELVKKCRKQNLVNARFVCIYLMLEYTNWDYLHIAEYFDQTYTLVYRARTRIKHEIGIYADIKEAVGWVEARILEESGQGGLKGKK